MKKITQNKLLKLRAAAGFTLIELMTVVAIMAVLGGVAAPAMISVMRNAQMEKAAVHGRQIAIALRSAAMDNDGIFPAGENFHGEEIATSNDAFRGLFPHYIDSERVFEVKKSAWGPKVDNRCKEPGDILQPRENHYAYIAGLSDTSNSDWPLIVDGTDGSGMYGKVRGKKGGCWEGTRGIYITVGCSARVIRLQGTDDERWLPREGYL